MRHDSMFRLAKVTITIFLTVSSRACAEYQAAFDDQVTVVHNATIPVAGCEAACIRLAAMTSFQVHARNTTLHDELRQGYWSAQQGSVSPHCFVQPENAEGVAAVIKVLESTRCHFAVRSGGHAALAGSSNSADGVTVDLRRLNEITVSEDRSTTRVGTGNRWIDVYDKLTPLGLAVVGGRVPNIGVGGLTLGGGISFFSGRRGWACDGVRNYEFVSADGEVLDVNQASYPDLYWALRGGGNNFGIVTRFDLETFEQGPMWGGSVLTAMDHNASLFQALVDFTHESPKDPDGGNWVAFIWAEAYGGWLASTQLVYAKPVEYPDVLKGFTDVPNVHSTLRLATLTDLVREVGTQNPDGFRETYSTFTFKNDAAVMGECLKIWKDEITPIRSVAGLVPALIFQSAPVDVLTGFVKNGGNCLGISAEDGPLIVGNMATMWADSVDDDTIRTAVQRVTNKCIEKGKQMGQGHRYLYQNYANLGQDVFASYGEANRDRLVDISEKYDPRRVFQTLQPGYFKLARGL